MPKCLASRIMADSTSRIFFESLEGEEGYLVGGSVRDALRGRRSPDRDFVVRRRTQSIASRIARRINGRMIRIGRYGLVRIAAADGITVDITKIRGGSIQHDLLTRDYTINAMAWSPRTGILDPCGGMSDIRARMIRMVSCGNLEDDPARILRAFRHAAELGFRIEADTTAALRRFAPLLERVKSERITLDIFRILSVEKSVSELQTMSNLGVLGKIIYFESNELRDLFQFLNQLIVRYDENALKVRRLGMYIPGQGLAYRGLLLLEALLVASPAGHCLTLSTGLRNRLRRLHEGLVQLRAESSIRGASVGRLYDVFRSAGEAAADLLLYAGCPQFLPLLALYHRSQRACGLNGREIMKVTGLREGPELGRSIDAIRRATFEGRIRTKASAVEFLRNQHRHGI